MKPDTDSAPLYGGSDVMSPSVSARQAHPDATGWMDVAGSQSVRWGWLLGQGSLERCGGVSLNVSLGNGGGRCA